MSFRRIFTLVLALFLVSGIAAFDYSNRSFENELLLELAKLPHNEELNSRNPATLLSENISYNWTENQWISSIKSNYLYNDWGYVTELTNYIPGVSQNSWEISSKTSSSYNQNHQLTTTLMEYYTQNNPTPLNKGEYTYTTAGLLEAINSFNYDNGSWMPTTRMHYSYNENQDISQLLIYTFTNNQFLASSKVEYLYNADNRVEEYCYYIRDDVNNLWTEYYLYEFEYNYSGFISENRSSTFDSSLNDWVWSSKTIYSYDEENNNTNYVMQMWSNNSWSDYIQTTNTFNSSNFMTETITQNYTNNSWVNSTKTNNYYSEIVANENLEDTPEVNPFLVQFKNPFNPNNQIKYTLQKDSKLTISIYNLRGEKINTLISEQSKAGSNSITWNGKNSINRDVANGVYLFKFDNSIQSTVKRVTLIK